MGRACTPAEALAYSSAKLGVPIMNHQTAEDAAERILKAINVELVRLPQAQHETILRIVTTELNTWLQAMAAGAQRAAAARREL
jgi:hypothetical protein